MTNYGWIPLPSVLLHSLMKAPNQSHCQFCGRFHGTQIEDKQTGYGE